MSPTSPETLAVTFYDGRTPVGESASLTRFGGTVQVVRAGLTAEYPVDRLRVSPRVGAADRFIALPDGGQLQCPDSPLLDALPQEGKTEGAVAWLERRWHVALLSVALSAAGVGTAYLYALPRLARHLAGRVPVEYDVQLGKQAMSWLDGKELAPSELDRRTRDQLTAGFRSLVRGLPLQNHYRLEFRKARSMGANAFALPGGTIVVTDELVRLAARKEEVLAVLAHEIGHVEGRHALRQVLQSSAAAAMLVALTADVSSLSVAAADLPAVLATTRYSRQLETEADEFGLALLARHDLSPEHLASMLERLRKGGDPNALRFLSTHPVTDERIARARAAARQ